MWATSWLMASVALFGVVQVQGAGDHGSWYNPQYAVPLLGMILGNTLNGVSLGLDRLGSELASKRDQVDTLLALGANRWEAARAAVQQSVRTGMIPTINTMMVVGLVSLPGMMTGQLIAGQDPAQAARYQIMIMFLLAAGTSLGTVGVVLLGYWRLFTHAHQFLPARLTKAL
jgi:putative ABC transport system permease protein